MAAMDEALDGRVEEEQRPMEESRKEARVNSVSFYVLELEPPIARKRLPSAEVLGRCLR